MQDLNGILTTATQCFQRGNLPQAELLSRHALELHGKNQAALNLLGMISLHINKPDFAVRHFESAIKLGPSDGQLKKNLLAARSQQKKQRQEQKHAHRQSTDASRQRRFLLIKAWGFGFWSDIDHVLGQLLLAEITGRTPVVHWGNNSLFRDESVDDAFGLYFEPVSEYNVSDLSGNSLSYYPPKWNRTNLLSDDVNKWQGPHSRMAALYFLNRHEDVAVGDFHTAVRALIPWISPGHPLHGMPLQEVYRYLFRKYLRPRPEILAEIEHFSNACLKKGPTLAVHVRGSDKAMESPELQAINKLYHAEITGFLSREEGMSIFLLTDSKPILDEYTEKYGDKLHYRNCARTDDATGVHYQEHASHKLIGTDVIMDTYLAAECDYFLGNGHSNVSTTVLHLKTWQPGTYKLFGESNLCVPKFFLHNW